MDQSKSENIKKRQLDLEELQDAEDKKKQKVNSDESSNINSIGNEGYTPVTNEISDVAHSKEKCINERPLTEVDVGISEYISNHCGFSGVIKQRHSDFLVTEVQLDGNEVKLDNLALPENDEKDLDALSQNFLGEILSETCLEELEKLKAQEDQKAEVVIRVENKSKEERRLIHTAVKKLYPAFCSNTDTRNNEKIIAITNPKKKNDNSTFQKGVRQSWPTSRGNYTHFTLYKENFDTMTAVNCIARVLRMNPGAFTYAGAKDKRGKTLQRVSVYRTEAKKLLGLNKTLKNIAIGNVTYCKAPLRLGALMGNKFSIVLRSVQGNADDINSAMTSLANVGFLNYYGLQRFGTTSVPTYSIGLALLKSDWKTAVELILKPRTGENDNMAECRKLWVTSSNPKAVVNFMKNKNCIEAHLLRGLMKHGNRDLVNALNRIPRNSRLMYIHSYQSYLWNRVLSRRIQMYGTKVLKGDLVLKSGECSDGADGQQMDTDSKKVVPTVLESEADAQIYDVVLPLFGYDVQYPQNEIAEWYRTMLQNDGFDVDNIHHRVKDYSLSGSYRHIVTRPQNTSWSLIKYSDPTVPILWSDWDILQKNVDTTLTSVDGNFLAVKLEFTLPRSVYATMALREVLHMDTSPSFQASLN